MLPSHSTPCWPAAALRCAMLGCLLLCGAEAPAYDEQGDTLAPGEVWAPGDDSSCCESSCCRGGYCCSCPRCCCREAWHLQVLPDGLIYRSYLAGVKEP